MTIHRGVSQSSSCPTLFLSGPYILLNKLSKAYCSAFISKYHTSIPVQTSHTNLKAAFWYQRSSCFRLFSSFSVWVFSSCRIDKLGGTICRLKILYLIKIYPQVLSIPKMLRRQLTSSLHFSWRLRELFYNLALWTNSCL